MPFVWRQTAWLANPKRTTLSDCILWRWFAVSSVIIGCTCTGLVGTSSAIVISEPVAEVKPVLGIEDIVVPSRSVDHYVAAPSEKIGNVNSLEQHCVMVAVPLVYRKDVKGIWREDADVLVKKIAADRMGIVETGRRGVFLYTDDENCFYFSSSRLPGIGYMNVALQGTVLRRCLRKSALYAQPCPLFYGEIAMAVSPHQTGNERINDYRSDACSLDKAPPPWSGFITAAIGIIGILWGWYALRGRNTRPGRSLLLFFGGVTLWIYGLARILPWWVVR
jgi:hypothetical protein